MTAFEPITGRYLALELDGVTHRVYVETAGSGIPLLLQHTAGSDNRQWRHLLNDAEIGQRFAMVAADLPGHGKSLFPDDSRWWASEYRLSRDFFMRFQVALTQALGLDRPVFMGCSIGGHLAADLALDYPGVFRACIGLQASAHTPSANEGSLLPLDNPRIGPDYAAALMRGLTSPTSPEARRQEVGFIYSQAAPGVFRGDLYYYTVDHDLRERARDIDTTKTPLYIMSGEYDWSSTSAASKELTDGCTRGEVHPHARPRPLPHGGRPGPLSRIPPPRPRRNRHQPLANEPRAPATGPLPLQSFAEGRRGPKSPQRVASSAVAAAKIPAMTPDTVFHWARIAAPGRGFAALAKQIEESTLPALEREGGSRWMLANALFGFWNHEVALITCWPEGGSPGARLVSALPAGASLVAHYDFLPTVRPTGTEPPSKPGIYVHRLFGVDGANVDRFVELSAEAWRTFENAGDYESQPQGLFKQRNHPKEDGLMLLVTWYDRLESWERSRTPPPEAAANFRERTQLTRRSVAYATRLVGTNPATRGMGAG